MNKYELIGVILGDGSIYYNEEKRVYTLEITGNADEELDYYAQIQTLLLALSHHEPILKIKNEAKGKSLKLFLHNKTFIKKLIWEYGLNFSDKTNSAFVPKKFLEWRYMKHILRGFFETDGCLFFSKVNNKYTYPRIELKTNSYKLASQFFNALSTNGFRVRLRKMPSDKTNVVYLCGKKQLEAWVKQIGFSSLKNSTKHKLWKKLTFYIPYTSTNKRLLILRRQVELTHI